jgi:hypothetical protein
MGTFCPTLNKTVTIGIDPNNSCSGYCWRPGPANESQISVRRKRSLYNPSLAFREPACHSRARLSGRPGCALAATYRNPGFAGTSITAAAVDGRAIRSGRRSTRRTRAIFVPLSVDDPKACAGVHFLDGQLHGTASLALNYLFETRAKIATGFIHVVREEICKARGGTIRDYSTRPGQLAH